MSAAGARRDEILDTASQMFASSGWRVSLQEIADECGIKPGSLYHHFDSKEAIVVELVERYLAELDRIAEIAVKELKGADPRLISEQIIELATAIAQCAVRHSAAVQFTFYEPPVADEALVELSGRSPAAIEAAMLESLRVGRSSGFIRSGVALEILADRMCQAMLHVGLGSFHRYPASGRAPALLCRILLHGLATVTPANAELDRSEALANLNRVVKDWSKEASPEDDRAELIRSVARAEFGRRGYEVTTVRDIAAAAGMGTGSVYRVIGSKEQLLASIMLSFAEKAIAGWNAALGSDASTVEKLDAVACLYIHVMDQLYDEYKIQLAWLRQFPPDANLGWSFSSFLRQLKGLLSEGVRSGELHIDSPSAELTARCVIDLLCVPENIVKSVGKRSALNHARDTVLRGVAKPRAAGH
jgi:AcrR family transcriptional regulator